MTDLKSRADILPSNATPRELAIAEADAAIEDRIATPIITARDPLQTPLTTLPYLAWERSVDVWDPVWPEDIRRAVVVAAPEVHRHKGTVYAVKTALAALRVDATVTEWWQTAPRSTPYTFSVTAYARARIYDGPVLDARLINTVFNTVLRTKPVSRAFDLTVGAAFEDMLGLAPVMTATIPVRHGVQPRPVTETQAMLGLAPVMVGATSLRRGVVPAPRSDTMSTLGVAPVAIGLTRLARAVVPTLPA